MGFKHCTKCGSLKPLDQFPLVKTGCERRRPHCKVCHVAAARAWAVANHDKYLARLRAWYDANARSPRVVLTREEKAARRLAYARRTKDRQAASKKKWADANKHIQMEIVRRRQAAKRRAVPAWASHKAMQKFYLAARRLTAETGIRHEVDHIVPIISSLVCGLHCEGNLRVITKAENRAKWNREWPNMP